MKQHIAIALAALRDKHSIPLRGASRARSEQKKAGSAHKRNAVPHLSAASKCVWQMDREG